jgi:cysteine synthase A
MLPDTGERYMSTPLFEGIGEEMDADELAISRSTPGCRFEPPAACALPAARPQSAPVALDPDVERFVDELIEKEPVVLFALEWCEFCWSVRKLFARLGVSFRSIDLDSVAYQADDRGGKVRAVVGQRAGQPTIPQVWIGGKHFGGCTELFGAVRDGSLQRWLAQRGIAYDASAQVDPDALLPMWLQPRKSA